MNMNRHLAVIAGVFFDALNMKAIVSLRDGRYTKNDDLVEQREIIVFSSFGTDYLKDAFRSVTKKRDLILTLCQNRARLSVVTQCQ